MNEEPSTSAHEQPPTAPSSPLLEKLTALVLVLVLLALGAIIAAAYYPGGALPAAWEPAAVLVLVGLLFAALVLVSVVALRHTRS